MKNHGFLRYEPEEPLQLPSDIRTWLPEDHLALFVRDVADSLDLSEITKTCEHPEGGHHAYHPVMMVKLLL